MAIFKCKMCGGALEITNNATVVCCDYCGTQQTLPKLDDERRANLYDRANHFRRSNEFDKAMGIYEQILNEDKTDAEAYWSLVLCRFGIEYVEDPATRKRVPTVNRAQLTSIFNDENYKSALQYADSYQRGIYEEEAKAINEIQKGILAISQKEEPFDVFICYKETDNNGRRTPDSVLANDIYHQLTNEGFKVFYAAITLEDKLGTAYEPYIFAALNSAKVMIVLGTKPEHFNAVWVKNEWSRYLNIMQNDRSRILIPCYKDMDAYYLPEEFAHLQAQDMSKIGFISDIVRGIKKVLAKGEDIAQKQSIASYGASSQPNNGTQLMLEDGAMYVGEVFANIPHGHGTAKYSSGETYEGYWDRGQKHGIGKIILPDGTECICEYKNGKLWTGKGIVNNDGSIYEGELRDGKKQGYGRCTYDNGTVYEGDFLDDKRHGHGKMVFATGATCEGEFLNDDLNGFFKYNYSNGDVYEGTFQNNMKHGHGKHTYANGDVYEGGWEEDKKKGYGKCIFANGDIYEGTYQNNMRHGHGKFTYADGCVYEGGWDGGKKHGHGRFTYPDGRCWIGEYRNGTPWNGEGLLYGKTGKTRNGQHSRFHLFS